MRETKPGAWLTPTPQTVKETATLGHGGQLVKMTDQELCRQVMRTCMVRQPSFARATAGGRESVVRVHGGLFEGLLLRDHADDFGRVKVKRSRRARRIA